MLPARAARLRSPLLLCPANLAPAVSRRTVLVLHDAAALRHPGWYAPAYVAWQRRLLPVLVARARLIVTVSAFSRDELVELLGADPGGIAIVPGGVDGRFTPAADTGAARRTHGLARPYVLCVASHTARPGRAPRGSCARCARRRRARRAVPDRGCGARPRCRRRA